LRKKPDNGVQGLRRHRLDAGGVLRRRRGVIGIIAMNAYKLTTKNIGRDKLLCAIFLASAAVTVIT
jgi:hypothetical protein